MWANKLCRSIQYGPWITLSSKPNSHLAPAKSWVVLLATGVKHVSTACEFVINEDFAIKVIFSRRDILKAMQDYYSFTNY